MDIVYQYDMPGNDDKYHLYSALCSLYSICCIPTMKMEAKEVSVFTGQYFSVVLKRQVTFSVVLPVDVFTPQGKIEYIDGPFPTMYLLHGFSGNHMDWLYNGHIMELAAMRRIAFVMPNGENSFYLDNPRSDQAYSEFIGKELVDVTRRLFPLSHKREETYIGGLSMGGFGALRNGLYYNDVFGAAAALSSALITDEVAQMKPGKGNFMARTNTTPTPSASPPPCSAATARPRPWRRCARKRGRRYPGCSWPAARRTSSIPPTWTCTKP